MLSQQYGRKAIWLYAAAAFCLECTDPQQLCIPCPGDYCPITLSTWIPHSQVVLFILLFPLAVLIHPRIVFPWSLCQPPPDKDTLHSMPLPGPGLLFSLHIHMPSSLAAVSLHPCVYSTCLHAACWQWLKYTLCVSGPLLHQNPNSLYIAHMLSCVHLCPTCTSLTSPSCLPEGCFLLVHQLQSSSGL